MWRDLQEHLGARDSRRPGLRSLLWWFYGENPEYAEYLVREAEKIFRTGLCTCGIGLIPARGEDDNAVLVEAEPGKGTPRLPAPPIANISFAPSAGARGLRRRGRF